MPRCDRWQVPRIVNDLSDSQRRRRQASNPHLPQSKRSACALLAAPVSRRQQHLRSVGEVELRATYRSGLRSAGTQVRAPLIGLVQVRGVPLQPESRAGAIGHLSGRSLLAATTSQR